MSFGKISVLLALLASPAHADTTPYNTLIRGKLDRVVDGDTIRIVGYKDSFRLYGIDAAEKKQTCTSRIDGEESTINYGELATDFLKKEILDDYMNTIITCDFDNTGRYNRPLATCYAQNQIYENINLNKLMVLRGRAFADYRYAKDAEYIALEAIAKENNWGMWHGRIKCEQPYEYRSQANKEKKRFAKEDLEPEPVIIDSAVGALYRVKNADTSPLLYSPEMDMMVNPDCPTESMEGTIRNQIGYGCNGADTLRVNRVKLKE
jgi:endonuclease YncB( thermonuclease family)